MKKRSILGVSFSDHTMAETITYLDWVLNKEKAQPFHIITANPEIVMQVNRDNEFKKIAEASDLIVADGIGIVWGSFILGRRIKNRIMGIDLLTELFGLCEQKKHSVYLLGASEETNQTLYEQIRKEYPNLKIAGRRNGYFDVDEDDEIVSQIRESDVDFLVMAMGSPRAHKWFKKNRDKLNIKMTIDVGGGFDALTGAVKRAPAFVQKMNIEWLYRRLQDPSRKERQKDLYRFAFEVVKERVWIGYRPRKSS
ncbi:MULTISPECIES: WecB/TagA/CpsF family glycosyltransferase [unclassified Fusibacter]|uniref:WecB/TagA/CpsF family glycosyltransferase n=1 Tax=unclassified Fusibacter TaxID=2624464 RepID=UPI0013E941C3|nr:MULTISPECIES: WecB/TagA/CpsF family glycosyltransferase [unclassified Fusibacter]MCK8060274.1 WecB/TagA/CpsF family glycosyltransferase [Fusibacter sp. A2]NPE20437.1 WecB/TagA/CpsF family glycosyltransferase [Fusibacter sp. A1]